MNDKKVQNDEYSGLNVLIMGLGLNGGNLEAAIYLGQRGAILCITDLRDEKILAPSIEKLQARLPQTASSIHYVLGRHEIDDFRKADMVIKNPGVRPDSPFLQNVTRIETDISLFLEASPARLSAVTGSKGKSSVTSAIHWVLQQQTELQNTETGKRRAYLGGNITLSPLGYLNDLTDRDDVVLELSSFQLGDLRGRKNSKTGEHLLKPRAAVISAIMPDHLDRYETMDSYIEDKREIYRGQDSKDVLVAGDDSWGKSFHDECRSRKLINSSIVLPGNVNGGWIDAEKQTGIANFNGSIMEVVPGQLLVPGKHQKKNMLSAALVLLDLGLDPEFIRESLGRFPGVEHRLEFFHEWNGIRFYNDTTATIPEAAAAAVRAFDRPPILVCGGNDKKLDLSPLADAAAEAASVILLAGTGSGKLAPALSAKNIKFSGPFDRLDKAVEAVLEKAGPGDIVVLSPGCTAFGMFLNEFDRGSKWKAEIRRCAGGH